MMNDWSTKSNKVAIRLRNEGGKGPNHHQKTTVINLQKTKCVD